MNVKTLEGLAGAGQNMKIMQTPLRIYKDAFRRGDIGKMEQAGGYVCEFADRTEKYKTLTDEGMKEEIQEAREAKAEEMKEEAEQEVSEQGKKAESAAYDVTISEEGKALLEREVTGNESERIQSGGSGIQPDTTGEQ